MYEITENDYDHVIHRKILPVSLIKSSCLTSTFFKNALISSQINRSKQNLFSIISFGTLISLEKWDIPKGNSGHFVWDIRVSIYAKTQ